MSFSEPELTWSNVLHSIGTSCIRQNGFWLTIINLLVFKVSLDSYSSGSCRLNTANPLFFVTNRFQERTGPLFSVFLTESSSPRKFILKTKVVLLTFDFLDN